MSVGSAIVAALGGRWRGQAGFARCPAHPEKTPSLHVTESRDGTILLHCFGGCSNEAVLDALRARGLWAGRDDKPLRPRPFPACRTVRDDGEDRTASARAIWNASHPIFGTHAERYLIARGIAPPLPPSLRFHPALKHGPSGLVLPALVAAVQAPDRAVVAIHRIFLDPGRPAKAPVERPVKMTLGPMGEGAARLGTAQRVLGLAEGIETGLSAQQLYGVPVWCALGTARFGRLALPSIVKRVVIFADAGPPGVKAALKAQEAYRSQSRKVSIAYPPAGDDFNEALQVGAAA